MDWKRTKKLMWRWSLISAAFFALFWGVWYLIAGEVPELTQIKWGKGNTYQLPFTISRWWDILFAPIWANLIVVSTKKLSSAQRAEDVIPFFWGMLLSFYSIILSSISYNIITTYLFTTILLYYIYIIYNYIMVVGEINISNWLIGIISGLITSLIIGITVIGLGPGLIMGIGIILIISLINALIIGILSCLLRLEGTLMPKI